MYGMRLDLKKLCHFSFGDERKDGVAQAMGISRSMLSAILSGHRKVNADQLIKCKAAYPELDLDATVMVLGKIRIKLNKIPIEEGTIDGL